MEGHTNWLWRWVRNYENCGQTSSFLFLAVGEMNVVGALRRFVVDCYERKGTVDEVIAVALRKLEESLGELEL